MISAARRFGGNFETSSRSVSTPPADEPMATTSRLRGFFLEADSTLASLESCSKKKRAPAALASKDAKRRSVRAAAGRNWLPSFEGRFRVQFLRIVLLPVGTRIHRKPPVSPSHLKLTRTEFGAVLFCTRRRNKNRSPLDRQFSRRNYGI